MPTIDSVVKTVRLPREEWEEIERNLNGRSFCSYVRGLGFGREKTEDEKELESMMKCFGLTLEEGMRMLVEGLDEGYLTVEDGKIVGV